MPKCSFCETEVEVSHSGCDAEYEARVAVMQHHIIDVLKEVDKIGRARLRHAYPELFRALDPLNLCCGANMGKTFLERSRLSEKVAQIVAVGGNHGEALEAYKTHRKFNGHNGWD